MFFITELNPELNTQIDLCQNSLCDISIMYE